MEQWLGWTKLWGPWGSFLNLCKLQLFLDVKWGIIIDLLSKVAMTVM